MLLSKLLLPTLKEAPQEAEVISHKLMLRAGMIRKVASGIYTWLPLGLKVLRKIENIVREEMNASGAQEVLMPMVQPKELWEETNRWEKMGPELLRIQDRHQRDFCLGPTHEEVITDLIRTNVRSYRHGLCGRCFTGFHSPPIWASSYRLLRYCFTHITYGGDLLEGVSLIFELPS